MSRVHLIFDRIYCLRKKKPLDKRLNVYIAAMFCLKSHMAGSELRLLNLATSHDRDKEDKGDGLEYHVDKGEEESEGADVFEGLP